MDNQTEFLQEGCTSLHDASRAGEVKVFGALIKAKADVESTDKVQLIVIRT